MRQVAGFTLIELIVVITILGILAAVALPKFFNVQDDARRALAAGVAGAVASGSTINYSKRMASNVSVGLTSATTVNQCTTAILGRLLTGGFPADIRVSTPAAGALTVGLALGATGNCEFFHSAFTAGTTTVNVVAVAN